MKKILVFTMSLLLLVSLVGCTVPEWPDETNNPTNTLLIVEEVTETYIICNSEDGGKYSIPNWFSDKNVNANEFIKVFHNGLIQETYPMQFDVIYKMTHFSANGDYNTVDTSGPLVSEDETTITQDKSEIYVKKTNGIIPLRKKLYNSDAEKVMALISDLENGDEYVCDCLPDYIIEINGSVHDYHSETGVLYNRETKTNLLVKEKEMLNTILDKYLGGILNGN